MSPDRDVRPGDEDPGLDAYDDEEPRSIFSALWFRGLLAVLVLGVLVAVAVPYVLDFATTPALKPKSPTAAPLVASPAPAPSPAPSAAAGSLPVASATATAAPVPAPAETAAPAPLKAAPTAQTPQAPAKARAERAVVAKAVEAPKPAPKAPAAKSEPDKAAAATATGGPYWVQVGAFKDPDVAKRVASRLREQGLRVGESTTTLPAARPAAAAPGASTAPGDLYDVLVTGAPAVDIEAKLTPKGFTGQSAENGVLVRPSLALRDAVALSRELSDGGLSVQVRRVSSTPPPPAVVPETGRATTLHRVRVGGFPDRATAMTAMKQLEEKGYKPFIARGE
jgi:cell division septation protein DedD